MNKKMIRKVTSSLSVAMMLGLGIAATSSVALAVELDNNNRLGDAGIFQYYTAAEGWQTFIRVINTSDNAVAFKVRVREAANSREVLDFTVLLSPYDVWSGWTDSNALGNGMPGLRTNDTSCLYPLPDNNPLGESWKTISGALKGAEFQDRGFTGVYDDGGNVDHDSIARMSEGHIEIIGIGQYSPTSRFGLAVEHDSETGKPNSCSNAITMYEAGAGGAGANARNSDLDNVLGMNGYVVNVAQGMGGGFDPDILRDFWTCTQEQDCPANTLTLREQSLATATDPDLDSAFNLDLANNGLNEARDKQKGYAGDMAVSGGVDQVSYALMRSAVINEWAASANPESVVSDYYTQWVLTFPTKHYYVDLQTDLNTGDDVSPTLVDPTVDSGASGNDAIRPFLNEFDWAGGISCEPYRMNIWNREERFSTYSSPAPDFPVDLCYETNVLVFNEYYEGQGLASAFSVTIPTGLLPTDVGGGVSERGWASMEFTGVTQDLDDLRYLDQDAEGGFDFRTGLPVTGFMLSVYNTNDSATNHSTINAHKYRVEEGSGG